MVNKALGLAVSVGIPLVGGFLGGLATMTEVKGWYTRIKKAQMDASELAVRARMERSIRGVAAWLVWLKKDAKSVRTPLILYGIQLALNFCWTPIFFKLHRPDIATVEATAIIGMATAATVSMSKVAGASKVLPLMLPYLGWMAFATALSANIAMNNPELPDCCLMYLVSAKSAMGIIVPAYTLVSLAGGEVYGEEAPLVASLDAHKIDASQPSEAAGKPSTAASKSTAAVKEA